MTARTCAERPLRRLLQPVDDDITSTGIVLITPDASTVTGPVPVIA